MWLPLLCACCIALLQLAPAEAGQSARFLQYTGEFDYGLNVLPPWADGGRLEINFPEHLERYPDTWGILRYSDKDPAGRWEVSADGMKAVLDVDSVTMPGVHVTGMGTVVSPTRIEFAMRIENHSDKTLPGIVPLYCFRYSGLTGFPKWQKNFQHTYVLMDGKVTKLADITTANPEADVKGGYVKGNPQRDSDHFPASRGGLITQPIDRAIIAIISLDGRRVMLLAWTPGKTILSNAAIPCAHADAYYGPIEPGKSVECTGVLIFTEEPVERAMQNMVREGLGGGGGPKG
ncbi:MAG: hypothetical protein ABSD48_20880 [Armatimonadota bacterium]|jgi:hypothetical protein